MTFKGWVATPVALALVACGGDSGGTGSSGGTITVVPPTPTPTPPPSPSYQSARDFTQDRAAQDFGARMETFRIFLPAGMPKRILSLATTTTLGAIGFSYSASSRTYRVNYFGETRDFARIQSYDSPGYVGDIDYNPSDPSPMRRFYRVVRSDLQNQANNLQYVGIASWSDYIGADMEAGERGDREIWRYQLYGAHTVASDLPTTGVSTYQLYFPLVKSVFDVQINWGTGEILGTARAACSQGEACPNGDVGEVRLNGSFDGSYRILGTISGSAGYSGTFVGGFYGPRALEIGVVGDYRHPTRDADIFFATSKR